MAESDREHQAAAAEDRRDIDAAQNGDRAAFERLVLRHRERLFGAAAAILREHETARDVTQETFVRAFQNLRRFDRRRPFYPWLYRIMHNLAIDTQRRTGPHRQVSLEHLVEQKHVVFSSADAHAAAPAHDPRESIYRTQKRELLLRALDTLKPEFREIILLQHFQEMSYKEIAEALGIPEGTVMSRRYYAFRALQKAVLALAEPSRGGDSDV